MLNGLPTTSPLGYSKRVGQSIAGVFIGLLLFAASFIVLYWNEGRQDMSEIATTAIEVDANVINDSAENQGMLISVTGPIEAEERLGDEYLNPGDYIALKRTVEMYAWEEEAVEESATNNDNATQTKYTYEKVWTSEVPQSSHFFYMNEHLNPEKIVEDQTFTVNDIQIGEYHLSNNDLNLPSYEKLSLNNEIVSLDTIIENVNQDFRYVRNNDFLFANIDSDLTPAICDDYIYIPQNGIDNPMIGDIRISYQIIPTDIEVTAFGKKQEAKITAYNDSDGNKLFRIIRGSRENAVATMHNAHVASTWALRVVGFILMWIGLSLIFGPISAVLTFIPILGKLSRGLIGVVTFATALVLSIITIFVSQIIHSIIALIVIGVIIVAAGAMIVMGRKNNKPSTPISTGTDGQNRIDQPSNNKPADTNTTKE